MDGFFNAARPMYRAINDRLAGMARSKFAPRLLLVVFALPCPVSFLRW